MADDIAVEDYQRMVGSIARKYCYNESDYEDLYQVGMLELWKATKKFDGSFGVKFSSFSYAYVLGGVLKYVRENRVVKISKELIKLNQSIAHAREVLTQKLMRGPTDTEIASVLGINEGELFEAVSATEYVRSLDYELNDEGKELNMYDSIRYDEKGYDEKILDLRNAIDELNNEDKALINSRYYEDKSQCETAMVLGTSQVQVSRRETKVLEKLYQDMAA